MILCNFNIKVFLKFKLAYIRIFLSPLFPDYPYFRLSGLPLAQFARINEVVPYLDVDWRRNLTSRPLRYSLLAPFPPYSWRPPVCVPKERDPDVGDEDRVSYPEDGEKAPRGSHDQSVMAFVDPLLVTTPIGRAVFLSQGLTQLSSSLFLISMTLPFFFLC